MSAQTTTDEHGNEVTATRDEAGRYVVTLTLDPENLKDHKPWLSALKLFLEEINRMRDEDRAAEDAA